MVCSLLELEILRSLLARNLLYPTAQSQRKLHVLLVIRIAVVGNYLYLLKYDLSIPFFRVR